jgi:phosphoenolpyruvate carboxykinase (ATP)
LIRGDLGNIPTRGEDAVPAARGGQRDREPEPGRGQGARGEDAERDADRYGNLNVQTDVVIRSKRSTFIVTDEPDGQNQAITREEGLKWAEAQDAYIAEQEMVVIDGYIGNDPDFRTPARLYIEAANANIAAMQQQLYFDRRTTCHEPGADRRLHAEPQGRGLPDDRLIAVDLEQGVTRVFNSDYFGESKKGGLRMWNKLVYDRGGLPCTRAARSSRRAAAARSG